MNKQAGMKLSNQIIFVDGELNFNNVMSVYAKSLSLIAQCSELAFDFSDLRSSDSSGLALIIEWVKLAKSRQKPIRFLHLPPYLQALATAASLDGLLA